MCVIGQAELLPVAIKQTIDTGPGQAHTLLHRQRCSPSWTNNGYSVSRTSNAILYFVNETEAQLQTWKWYSRVPLFPSRGTNSEEIANRFPWGLIGIRNTAQRGEQRLSSLFLTSYKHRFDPFHQNSDGRTLVFLSLGVPVGWVPVSVPGSVFVWFGWFGPGSFLAWSCSGFPPTPWHPT